MDIRKFEDFASATQEETFPPVHLWNPENCGDIGMEIRHDGSWWHAGGRINRAKIVKLFSRILRKDEDGIYLVTPYEKVIVHVETTPFLAVDFAIKNAGSKDQNLIFKSNLGEYVTASSTHPLSLETDGKSKFPTIDFRRGLLARLTRACHYDLLNIIGESVSVEGSYSIRSGQKDFEIEVKANG